MGNSDLLKKHQKIRSWLEKLYVNKEIPSYEVNPETVIYLDKLCNYQQRIEFITKLQIEDVTRKVKEYNVESRRIQEIIDRAGISIFNLSNSAKTNLKSLVDISSVLDLKNTKESSYLMGVDDLKTQLQNTSAEILEKEKELERSVKSYEKSIHSVNNIYSFYENVDIKAITDTPVKEKRNKQVETMKAKLESYNIQIDEFESDDSYKNVDDRLFHENILKLSNELEELKSQLAPLRKKFQVYRSLPPDINLAKVKIEEAKMELNKLESQLQADIDLMNM